MKKNYLTILLFLFIYGVSAQNCNFTFQTNPGTTTVSFAANQILTQSHYTFVWDFGDNTTGAGAFPVHTYNSSGPFQVCYDVIDSNSTIICSACDSIFFIAGPNCSFVFSNTGSTFAFSAIGTQGGLISWDFGDSTSGAGSQISHTFQSSGQFIVTMTSTDTMGTVLCTYTALITSPVTGSGCSFTALIQPMGASFMALNVAPNSLVSWDFGDGSTGTGYQVSHAYAVSGTYNVCMTAMDLNGIPCSDCQLITVTVTTGNCYFTAIPDSMNPNTFDFTAVPAYPNSYISWDFGDGSTGTGNSVSHIFSSVGTYTVCMTESDSSGVLCTSCQSITIHNTPQCNYTYSVSILNPLAVNFQANGASNTITWDFGDGTTGTGANASHTYAVAGIYQVCMSSGTPGTSNYCTSCNVVAVGNSTSFCTVSFYPDPLQPNTFVFTSTQSSPSSFIVWDFGDNTIGTGQTVTHTYNTAGVYVVCLTERDSMQNIVCQNCVTIQVSGGSTNVCQASYIATSFGLDAYFIDMSIVNSPLVQYSWDFGDGNTSSLQFPQHTYAIPGLYNVCLTISDSSCTDVFCAPLLIDTNVFNPGNGCNAFYAFIQLAPYQVTVVNLSSGLNLSYDWDYGDGSPHDSNPYPSHFYTSTGTYNLCLTVSDANGCTSTYCDTLSVDSLGNIYRMASTGFTLNIVSPAQLTGVNEVAFEKTFSIYPNPFSSELHVAMLNSSQKANDYRIFSIQGAEILRGNLEGTNGVINTQTLSPGVYLFEVNLTDGSRGYQRVIKN